MIAVRICLLAIFFRLDDSAGIERPRCARFQSLKVSRNSIASQF
jgi:hypothetical protein